MTQRIDRMAEAHAFGQLVAQEVVRDTCRVTAHPCARGGWRVGYRYSGNVTIQFSWRKTLRDPAGIGGEDSLTYRGLPRLEKVRRWYDRRVLPELQRAAQWLRLLGLYRLSGLISVRVAKEHNAKSRAKFGTGWRHNPDALNEATLRAGRYVARYGQCPKCGERGKLAEEIVGWHCYPCRRSWADFNVYNQEWVESPGLCDWKDQFNIE